jgi:hypothetical protein
MYFWPVNEMIELVSGMPAPQFRDESPWALDQSWFNVQTIIVLRFFSCKMFSFTPPGVSLSQIKYNCYRKRSFLILLFLFLQGGYNARIKAIHILNAPPYADAFIAMLKLVLRSKIAARVTIPLHTFIFPTQIAILSSVSSYFRPLFLVPPCSWSLCSVE